MEQMDNKETTRSSSRLKILDAGHVEPSASKLEWNPFRWLAHVMPKHEHEKLYDSKDCQDRCEQAATRGMDFPLSRWSRVAARRPAPAAVRQ